MTALVPDVRDARELRRRFPAVVALPGTAEQLPVDTAAVDAVLVGQAFHWFDQEAAFAEIGRVLRPGGVVGALWNADDTAVEWVAGLAAVWHPSVADGEPELDWVPPLPLFEQCTRTRLPHRQRRTVDSLAETLGTHSRLIVLPPAERAAALDRIRAYLAARPETSGGEFDVPLVTTAVRARRR